MVTNYLEDNNGNRSSKRLWGSIILGFAVGLSVIMAAIDILYDIKVEPTTIDIMKYMYLSGSGLLGIGVFEGIFNHKKDENNSDL